jgi:endonuclease/exonuclease/phosphatase family metal-dependent hydrolase
VDIITWNANRVDRYNQLWNEQLVRSLQWDLICLQEVGNPEPAWVRQSGPPWPDPNKGQNPNQMVLRRYTFAPPGVGQVHILHGEWPNRQKNHVVMITKSRANWVAHVTDGNTIRPVLGIKIRLTWVDYMGQSVGTKDVLVACVHILSSDKAAWEVNDSLSNLEGACRAANATGWILVGDFNCEPDKLLAFLRTKPQNPPVGQRSPHFATHDSNHMLDYLVAHPADEILKCGFQMWAQGRAKSDHLLVKYTQVSGPSVQFPA